MCLHFPYEIHLLQRSLIQPEKEYIPVQWETYIHPKYVTQLHHFSSCYLRGSGKYTSFSIFTHSSYISFWGMLVRPRKVYTCIHVNALMMKDIESCICRVVLKIQDYTVGKQSTLTCTTHILLSIVRVYETKCPGYIDSLVSI